MKDKYNPRFGQLITINATAPYFVGEKAHIAYIGDEGVSVYLKNHIIDDCIVFKYGEYDE